MDKGPIDKSPNEVGVQPSRIPPEKAGQNVKPSSLNDRQRQFAESYARARNKLNHTEWANRFGVSRRTILYWLKNPEVQKIIEVISAQAEVDVQIDRKFVEALTSEERLKLQTLLSQQEKLDSDPAFKYSIEDLSDMIVKRVMVSTQQEVHHLTDVLDNLLCAIRSV